MIHDTQSAQTSQKQDEHNIYVLSWKQCALPVITKMDLWQPMHLGNLNWDMLNKLQTITFLLSNRLKFSEISYSKALAKTSSDRFRVYLSSLALLVEELMIIIIIVIVIIITISIVVIINSRSVRAQVLCVCTNRKY